MTTVAVLSTSGKKLMPTNSYRARKLLKSKRAVIYKHRPIFTIKLVDRIDGYTQTIEYKCDTGYQNIGISICSDTKEFVNEQRDLLKDETERHNNRRKYRRTRRNRLRYRKARWNNRKGMISKDGFAPSIRNKRDVHIRLYEKYYKVFPITKVVFEMGQFDTQVLKAVEAGLPVPEGMDYQQGEQYGYATLREAVFARDNYTCICCGKSAIKDGVKLKIHHIGYLSGDRSNRMDNLSSVCENCHTPTNHKPGDKVLFEGQKYFVAGIQNNGDYIKLTNGKVCSLKKVRVLQHCNAWAAVIQEGIHPTTYKGRKYFAKIMIKNIRKLLYFFKYIV